MHAIGKADEYLNYIPKNETLKQQAIKVGQDSYGSTQIDIPGHGVWDTSTGMIVYLEDDRSGIGVSDMNDIISKQMARVSLGMAPDESDLEY